MTFRETLLRGTHMPPEFEENKLSYAPQPGNGNKLNVYNWIDELPSTVHDTEIVEIRFKNTRKAFYLNSNKLSLQTGDIVAVEASPGHDLGIVSLTGELVKTQLKKYGIRPNVRDLKKVYRKAKQVDIEKWYQAIALEENTMLKARKIAEDLQLNMKIGDVEYQGDKTKAIFYYIADERVDFRQLIRILAEEFRIRIEMKQIGARQEAGRIGGIGSCGRELCCATWITNFSSVTTTAARYQEVSLNPQKLAGQCSKLKCCLNYELECYLDAQDDFPARETNLEIKNATAYYFKTDIYRRLMWYSYDPFNIVNLTAVPVERVKEIIELNNNGKKPDKLVNEPVTINKIPAENDIRYTNDVGTESLTRFDGKKTNKRTKKKRKGKFRKQNDNAKKY
ncbi:MAG: PSP1 domain-containing protein [Bacteroidota bacterium]